MRTRLLNNLGNPHRGVPEEDDLRPYIVDASGEVTYICYFDTPRRAIHRLSTVNGVTSCHWAYGRWEDRASLTYIPINEPMEVEDGGKI